VHSARARIEQRLDGGIGMRRRARIVRIVDKAGDAGVDAAERGDQVAGIHILGRIERREALVRGGHVFADRGAVRNDGAQLAFPGMAMAIDHARNEDRTGGIDHDDIAVLRSGAKVAADGRNRLAGHEDVARGEIADGGIGGEDGAALEQHAPGCRIGAEKPLQRCGIVPVSRLRRCRAGGKPQRRCAGRGLEDFAARGRSIIFLSIACHGCLLVHLPQP
jgi:hypothetical protein